MKYVLVVVLILSITSMSSAYGHKLIFHDDSHTSMDNPLSIPDHKISWAVYDNLDANQAKFYSFEAKAGDSFYASIVIPKIVGLENYSPTMILLPLTSENNDSSNQFHQKKFLYEGNFPGFEFYEPFGQVTYWERQEINTILPETGTFMIVVVDEKNQPGKYSLAVGTIEDFSGADLFTILPQAWVATKLFVEDYLSLVIAFVLFMTPFFILIMKFRKKLTRKIEI